MHNLLNEAVLYLKGEKIIKRDGDIADKTGYNKTTISSYLSGRIVPSPKFIEVFEQTFNIKLKDFGKGGKFEPIPLKNPMSEVISQVIKNGADIRVNQSLLLELLSAQTGKTIMELQRIVTEARGAELKSGLDELKRQNLI